jgi:polysaccharide biosynthesis protein PslE
MNSVQSANSSLRIFLHILFKRKFFIVSFFMITLIIAAIYAAKTEPAYQASCQILVKLGREHFFVPTSTDEAFRPTISFNSLEQINSEIELIKSRHIIEKAVNKIGPTVIYAGLVDKEPGLFKRLHLWMTGFLGRYSRETRENIQGKQKELTKEESAVLGVQENLDVQGIRNSRVIEISFKNKDPQIAAKVVAEIVNTYLQMRPHIYKNPESFAFFQDQSKILKGKISKLEEGLRTFKEQNDISALKEERSILLQKKSDLQATLNQSQSEKLETENRITQISGQLKATPERIQQGESTNLNAMLINTLEERLIALEIKEKELLAKYTDDNHLVQDVRNQLKIVRSKLADKETKRYGLENFGPNPTHQRLKEDLFRNQAELAAIDAKISSQKTYLDEYKTRLDALNQFEHQLEDLERQLQVEQKNYELYLIKHEETRISSEMDSKNIANVSIMEPAKLPLKPTGNKTLLSLAIGIFIAVFGSIGLAIFFEFLNEDLERPEDIEELLGAPVLASVPQSKR